MKRIIDEILDGKDLFVVLESNKSRPYKESYNLDTIIMKDGLFWGKFQSVHSPIGHPIDTVTPLAYAYNNFADVVCTMSYTDRIQRYVTTKIYSRIQFKTKGDFKLAIDGCSTAKYIKYDLLNSSVENALKIKLVICEDSDVIHVVSVHTIELHNDEVNFSIDTNFESVPSLLYNFSYFMGLENKFNKFLIDSENVSTKYLKESDFSLISYTISENNIYKNSLNKDGVIDCVAIDFKWFKVFCEV